MKHGSAVRIFTNRPASAFTLPSDEGYKRCAPCNKWVYSNNVHCKLCGGCMGKASADAVTSDQGCGVGRFFRIPTPAVLKNRLPTPAFLKTRLRLPTPVILKKRLRLQLKTCDSTNSDSTTLLLTTLSKLSVYQHHEYHCLKLFPPYTTLMLFDVLRMALATSTAAAAASASSLPGSTAKTAANASLRTTSARLPCP